jgi:hypothetical protein
VVEKDAAATAHASDARYVKRLVTIRFSFLRPGEIPTLIVEDPQPGSEIVPSCRLDRGSLAFKTFCRPWNRDVWWGNRAPSTGWLLMKDEGTTLGPSLEQNLKL